MASGTGSACVTAPQSAGCESTAVATSPVQLSVTYGLVGCGERASGAAGEAPKAVRMRRTAHSDGSTRTSTVSEPSSPSQPLLGSARSVSSSSCVKPQSFSRLPRARESQQWRNRRASPEQLLHAPVKLVLRHFHQRRRCAVGHDEREARELDPERRQAALEVAGDRQIQRQERHRVAAREQQQAPREAAGVEGGSVRAVGGILLKGGPVVDAPPEAAGRTRQAQPGVSAA